MRFQSIALAFALSATVIAHPQRNGDRDGDDDDLNDNNNNTPDVGDVDFDDVPVACQDTCNPVVTLTQRCDTNTTDDDVAEYNCICNDSSARTAVPACAACISQNGGWGGRNDDVNDILRACSFTSGSFAPTVGPTPTGPKGNNGGSGAPAPTGSGGQGGGAAAPAPTGNGGQSGGAAPAPTGSGGQAGNGQNTNVGSGAIQNTGQPNGASGNKLAASALLGVVGVAGLAFFL